MQTVRRRLADQVIGHDVLLLGPVELLAQLLQAFATGEGALDALGAAGGVVLGLVKDRLGGEDPHQAVLRLEGLLGVQQFGQFVDIDVGLGTLLLEQFGTLGARRLERLHPGGGRRRHD